MFIDFREKGRGREREGKEEKERYWSVASYSHPNQGSNLQSRYVP